MTSKYNHNCRLVEISNAIPELAYKNEDLIPLPKVNGRELSYREAFQQRIKSIPYYKNHKYRRDAVLGYDILLTYSRDDNVDVEEWKKRSIQWLKDTYNIAGDGKDNVLHAVFHGDEVGNPHIHAFVIPINKKTDYPLGRLQMDEGVWDNFNRLTLKASKI